VGVKSQKKERGGKECFEDLTSGGELTKLGFTRENMNHERHTLYLKEENKKDQGQSQRKRRQRREGKEESECLSPSLMLCSVWGLWEGGQKKARRR